MGLRLVKAICQITLGSSTRYGRTSCEAGNWVSDNLLVGGVSRHSLDRLDTSNDS